MGHIGKGDPAPFKLEGGAAGILLLHGFTGSPAEMRLLGNYLNERGLTVHAPLLPGHGTEVEDLNQVSWQDWTVAADSALVDLQARCQHVFVAGLSMGGLLTLYLASRHPELTGIITYAAALDITDWRRHLAPIIKRFFKTIGKPEEHWADPQAEDLLWSYDVYPVGGAVQLISYSTADETVTAEGAQQVFETINSTDKELVKMTVCGHVMTVDLGWEELAEKTYRFITTRVPEPAHNTVEQIADS